MANEQNLIGHQYQKGQSGNPDGLKKGTKQAKTILSQFMPLIISAKNPLTKETENLSVEQLANLKLLEKCLKGDINAYKEVYDRLEGKPVQTSNISVNDDGIAKKIAERMGIDTNDAEQES